MVIMKQLEMHIYSKYSEQAMANLILHIPTHISISHAFLDIADDALDSKK